MLNLIKSVHEAWKEAMANDCEEHGRSFVKKLWLSFRAFLILLNLTAS